MQVQQTTMKHTTEKQAPYGTAGWLAVRGKIHLPKMEHPKFEGHVTPNGWMDAWLGFNGILSTQVAAISCLKKFKVC